MTQHLTELLVLDALPRGRPPRRTLLPTLLVAALASLFGCTDSVPRVADAGHDAAPPCTVGTENCACGSSGTCEEQLLCVAGLCLSSEGPREPVRPSVTRPQIPLGTPGALDAAPPDDQLLDASTDAAAVEDLDDASVGADAALTD